MSQEIGITNYFIEDVQPSGGNNNHNIDITEQSIHINEPIQQYNFPKLFDLCLLSIKVNNQNAIDLYMILQAFLSRGSEQIQSKYNDCVVWIITRLHEIDASRLPRIDDMNYFRMMNEFYKQSFIIDFSITDSKELFGILKESIFERQERYLESYNRNEKEIKSIIVDIERLNCKTFILNWDRRQQRAILEARLLIRQKEKEKLENQRISNQRLQDFYIKHATAFNAFYLSGC